MNPEWESLIAALRAEVEEYGGLLALFSEQQAAILSRNAELILKISESISHQTASIAACKRHREHLVEAAAERLRHPPETTLRQLLPRFPRTVQPLFDALISEINHLIGRARRRDQQTQMLLERSIEVLEQQVIQSVKPGGTTRTRPPRSRMKIGTNRAGMRYLVGT